MNRNLVVIALLLVAPARAATVLTFEQVLSRAAHVRAVPTTVHFGSAMGSLFWKRH